MALLGMLSTWRPRLGCLRWMKDQARSGMSSSLSLRGGIRMVNTPRQ